MSQYRKFSSFNPLLKPLSLVMLLAMLSFFTGPDEAAAQGPNPLDRQLSIEEERIIDILEETEWRVIKPRKQTTYDWGGWLTTTRYSFEDFDHESVLPDSVEGSTVLDLRLWTKVFYPGGNSLYFRTKSQFIYSDFAGALAARDDTDLDGPHVDMAYFTLPATGSQRTKVGRQYFRLGRGLVLSNIMDGIDFSKRYPRSSFRIFTARTRPHDNNIDTSVPGWDLGSKRYFYGFSGQHRLIWGRTFYTYLLWEDDKSSEKPEDPAQGHDYDAFYTAFGTKGALNKEINYWGEVVRQSGEAPVSGTNTTTRIQASAYTVGARWMPEIRHKPTLSFEILEGSGDPDRANVVNAFGGKQSVSTDKGFLHFSPSGLGAAFTPRLSNLRAMRTVFTFKTLDNQTGRRDMMVSVVDTRYRKLYDAGAISDLQATEPSRDVGREIGLYISWKVSSDLSANIVFGQFSPGGAYPAASQSKSKYVSVGISCTF